MNVIFKTLMKTKQQKNNSVTVVNKDQIQSYIMTTAKYDFSVYEKFLLPATYRGGVITHLIYILHIPAKHFMNEFLLIYEFYYLLFTQPQILSFNAKAAHQ